MSACTNPLGATVTEAAIIAGAITRNRSRECALCVPSEPALELMRPIPPLAFLASSAATRFPWSSYVLRLCAVVFLISLLRVTSLAFVSNADGVHVQGLCGS
jgi:hypothetical protein